AAGFLREQVAGRHNDDESAAEQPDEVAPLQLEGVAPSFGELVAFRFQIHYLDPPTRGDVTPRIRSAARRTALTMRGYVPQRQTLRSMRRAMSCSLWFGFVFSIP